MLFAKYGQGLLIAHERQSRYTILDNPPDRKAERTASRLAKLFEPIPPPLRKTLTIDNGTEFALHSRVHLPAFAGMTIFEQRRHYGSKSSGRQFDRLAVRRAVGGVVPGVAVAVEGLRWS